MDDLARCYVKIGRFADALVLDKKLLEYHQRILPENHPEIGDVDASAVTAI